MNDMTKIRDIIKTLDDNPVLFDRVTVRCIIQFIDNTTINLTDFKNLIAIDAIQLLEFIEVAKEYKIPCRPNPQTKSIVVSIIGPDNKVLLRAEETVDPNLYYMQFFYTVIGTGRILEENSNRFRSLREYLMSMLNESFNNYSSMINICQTTLLIKLIEERKR